MDVNRISTLEPTLVVLLYDKMIYSIIEVVTFKQTSGCNVTSTYTELNLIKNTLWGDHCQLKGCSMTIFLLSSNMKGLRKFIYYAHNFDNVNQ